MTMSRLFHVRIFLCCLAAAAAGRAEETVQVTVVAILASDKDTFVDKRLADFAKEVQKKNPKLTGFRVADSKVGRLALGVTAPFPLVDKEAVDVTANASKTDEGKITITIKPPKHDQITYNCVCNRYFSMATQYYTKDKEQLFIAVTAKPCPAAEKEKPKEPAKGK